MENIEKIHLDRILSKMHEDLSKVLEQEIGKKNNKETKLEVEKLTNNLLSKNMIYLLMI
jgi:hypothetical protein